jgi:hypothetical protein
MHDSSFYYLNPANVQQVGPVDQDFYNQAANQLAICHIDVFLYNSAEKTYLLLNLADECDQPLRGLVYKGENFFKSAERNCFEKLGIKACAIKKLGVEETFFMI